MPKLSKILISGFFILFSIQVNVSFSQVPVKKSENKVIIEGNIYYIHIVKPGQTLYSISKAYGVTEKAIAIENPGVYSGLQIGQPLKIPADAPAPVSAGRDVDTLSFFEHRLQRGETIFSLSRRYNVPVDEIEEANPGIDVNDLSIGQVILIPKLNTVWSDEDFELHKVRRRETLFSLSRRYGVTEEEIRKYNPELQWGGLKTGQVIRIPKEEFLAEQKEQKDTPIVEVPDTLSVIVEPGMDEYSYVDSLGLEEKSIEDYYDDLKDFNRRRLNIAYLIPFNYREVDTARVIREDGKEKKEEEQNEEQNNLPQSVQFLEFFEGSLLALDSLKREGYSLNVQFFDTYKSPTKVREILNSAFFRNVDLIIGPFYAYNVEIVSEFSRQNRVPMVSPFYDGQELTDRNPYLFQMNPSYRTEYASAARILARDYDKNFIFVFRQDSMRYHEVEFFKNQLIRNLEKYIHPENVVIKEISYDNPAKANLVGDFSHTLSKDRKNIVIIPESNEAFVTPIITQLYFQLKEFDIEIFGLPYFYEFEGMLFQYFHELGLEFLSPFYYDYQDEQVSYFLKKYRDHFRAEPGGATKKGCSYAFMGYDVSYFFIKQLLQYDRRFVSRLNGSNIHTLLPDFYFHRNTPYGGFENQSLKLIEFTRDFGILSKDVETGGIEERQEYPATFPFGENKQ